MIIAVTAIILTTIICAAIVACRIIEDSSIAQLMRERKQFAEARKIIVNTVEIGDRLTDEELQLLYKLVK